MKFALVFALLSATVIKCWAAVILWGAVGPAAMAVVAWMALGTWLALAGAGVGASGLRSFVGEFNGTLVLYSAIVAFDCYALWYGLASGSRELAWLAALFLAIGVGCWVWIRVSERRRVVRPAPDSIATDGAVQCPIHVVREV